MKTSEVPKRCIQKERVMVLGKELNGTAPPHSNARRTTVFYLERPAQAVFLHHALDRFTVHPGLTRSPPHMPIVAFEKID